MQVVHPHAPSIMSCKTHRASCCCCCCCWWKQMGCCYNERDRRSAASIAFPVIWQKRVRMNESLSVDGPPHRVNTMKYKCPLSGHCGRRHADARARSSVAATDERIRILTGKKPPPDRLNHAADGFRDVIDSEARAKRCRAQHLTAVDVGRIEQPNTFDRRWKAEEHLGDVVMLQYGDGDWLRSRGTESMTTASDSIILGNFSSNGDACICDAQSDGGFARSSRASFITSSQYITVIMWR